MAKARLAPSGGLSVALAVAVAPAHARVVKATPTDAADHLNEQEGVPTRLVLVASGHPSGSVTRKTWAFLS